MFNIQINDESDPKILRAFANLFGELAGDADVVKADHRIAPADSPAAGKEEMTGTQYLEHLHTQIAAERRDTTAPDTIDAAEVFGTHRDISRTVHPDGPVSTISIGLPPDIDPSEVFGAPAVPNVPPVSDQVAASAPAPNTNGVPLDANGLPWDARINAGTKTQTAAGVWKAKKGVDAALVESVTAELRTILAIPVKPFVPLNAAPPPPPSPNVAPPPPPPPAQTTVAPAPPPTTVASQDAVTAPKTFVEVCQYVTSRAIAAATILEICAKHGLPGLGKLAIRPDLCDTLYNEFAAL